MSEKNNLINEENKNTDSQISNTDSKIYSQISNTDSKLSNKPILKRRNAVANFELTESYQEFIKEYNKQNEKQK